MDSVKAESNIENATGRLLCRRGLQHGQGVAKEDRLFDDCKRKWVEREVVVKCRGMRDRAKIRVEHDSKRIYARDYRRLNSSKGMGVGGITIVRYVPQ